ncbi:MAG: hypothetical protein V4666_06305 [Bacteroidota bacterium]
MKSKNNEKQYSSSQILDKDYISKIKSEFEELLGDDEILPTTLEYIENFNDYFLKYPYK